MLYAINRYIYSILSNDQFIFLGNLGRPLADENIVRTIIEFLTYLHLKGKWMPFKSSYF